MKTLIGYHFTNEKLRNGDPIPKVGEWLCYEGEVVPCESGLHMSEHPFDALQYAPGHTIHRVELRGDLKSHGEPIDKWVGRERRILMSANAEKLCWDFARWNAIQVIHLWRAPEVVKKYLETGDESLRAAASGAARAAARAAAWDDAIKKSRDKFAEMVEALLSNDKLTDSAESAKPSSSAAIG